MKKTVLIFFLFFFIKISFSQEFNKNFAAQIDSSGMYLKNSSMNLKLSIGTSILSGAFAFWAIDILKNDIDALPLLQYSLTGFFGVISIISYIKFINHIGKSGEHLIKASKCLPKKNNKFTIQTDSYGIGLVYKF